MATLIPTLGSARFDTRGELRLAERTRDFMEDNTCIWHNLPIGPRGRHPDFVIAHPGQGLLVLEVKDWRLDTILSATKMEVELLTDRGPVRQINPLEQGRAYMFEVVRVLERDEPLVYDNAQAIFKGREMPVWRRLGIDARGRTTVLKINYRNTGQILSFAKQFAADVIGAPGVQGDDEAAVLIPEGGGREGPEPEVRRCVSFDAEVHAIAEWLSARKHAGYEWPQMAVLYPQHHIGDAFARIFRKREIPIDIARDHRNRVSVAVPAVRMLTMHASKGLEFPCVAIGGLGALGSSKTALEDDVRLTYVAITRATHEAFLTYSRISSLVERLIA